MGQGIITLSQRLRAVGVGVVRMIDYRATMVNLRRRGPVRIRRRRCGLCRAGSGRRGSPC